MHEFIKGYYTELNASILLIVSIFGVLYYNKFKNTKVRIFIYYIFYVAFVDLVGSYPAYFYNYESLFYFRDLLKDTLFESNYWWFTIFWSIGSAVFTSYYFFNILNSKIFKKNIKWMCVLFILSSGICIITAIESLFTGSIPFIKIFGALVILSCITMYFIELLNSDRILYFFKTFDALVSSTLFIWWLIITPLIFYDVYFKTTDWNFVVLRWEIYFFANVFMYSSFAIALAWCNPEMKLGIKGNLPSAKHPQ